MPLFADTDLAQEIERLKQEEIRYELKKNIAESKKSIFEAEKNLLIAEAIKGTTEAPKGSITIDNIGGQTAIEYVAYMSLEEQAMKIAKEINKHFKNKGDMKILIVDNNDYFTKSASIIQMKNQFEFHKKEYASRVEETDKLISDTKKFYKYLQKTNEKANLLLTLPLISAGLSAITDIASFFKTDYDIKGKTIQANDFVLSVLIERDINKTVVDVRISNFLKVSNDSKLLKDLNSILEGTYTIKQKNITLEKYKKTLTKFISDKKTIKDFKEDFKQAGDYIKSIDTLYEKNKLFNAQFTNFNKSISMNVENGVSLLGTALIQDNIKTQKFTHLLYAKAISFGGDLVSTKKARKSGSLKAYGGSIIIYTLTDRKGKIELSEKHSGVKKWLVPIK